MRQVEESILIASSSTTIWEHLMDTASWPEWNTFVTSIEVQPPHSQLTVGSTQLITIVPDPDRAPAPQSYTNTISTLLPERELRWNGSVGHAIIFNTEHWCKLEPVVDAEGQSTSTRFIQGERITGLLAPIVKAMGKLEQLRLGYLRMNDDLKRRVEGITV